MNWEKLGRVYVASGETEWQQSHAFLPTPVRLDDESIRVYVAFLDADNVGRVGYVDVNAYDPQTVVSVSSDPVLDIGERGTFDCWGVNPGSIVKVDGRLLLYYIGWQRAKKVRYFLFTGLAVSEDGGETFERHSQTPILDRTDGELYTRGGCFGLQTDGGVEMWYAGGDRWITHDGKEMPAYDLRYIQSDDGYRWSGGGTPVLVPGDDEFGFGRPCVVRENGQYRMWTSIRSKQKGYRIGYAASADGVDWTRLDDDVGITVADSGWDSEMILLPSIIDVSGERYMFYNGNNYGESGFGVARLESGS